MVKRPRWFLPHPSLLTQAKTLQVRKFWLPLCLPSRPLIPSVGRNCPVSQHRHQMEFGKNLLKNSPVGGYQCSATRERPELTSLVNHRPPRGKHLSLPSTLKQLSKTPLKLPTKRGSSNQRKREIKTQKNLVGQKSPWALEIVKHSPANQPQYTALQGLLDPGIQSEVPGTASAFLTNYICHCSLFCLLLFYPEEHLLCPTCKTYFFCLKYFSPPSQPTPIPASGLNPK